jgi:hypothetical protein
MRAVTLAVICVGLLAACGGVAPRRPASQEFHRLEAEFDQAWEAAVRTLMERGYEIRATDRAAGVVETGWLTINPEYSATVFVTEHEDRYSVCGKPALGQTFGSKQGRLSVMLQPIRRGETGLRAEAFFRTQRYLDFLFWSHRLLGDVECSSRGRLEDEIWLQIQFRALSVHLERLRKGAP